MGIWHFKIPKRTKRSQNQDHVTDGLYPLEMSAQYVKMTCWEDHRNLAIASRSIIQWHDVTSYVQFICIRYGCGKSVHLKCVKLWAEHQKSQGERAIICPLCREKFSTFEVIMWQVILTFIMICKCRSYGKSSTPKETGQPRSLYIMELHAASVGFVLYQGNATSERDMHTKYAL